MNLYYIALIDFYKRLEKTPYSGLRSAVKELIIIEKQRENQREKENAL